MHGARAELKAAIEILAGVTKQIEKLESAVNRAGDAAEQAKGEVARYSGLDKEITSWRVSQVKKGLPTKTLPEKLKANLDAKRAAEEEHSQALGTRDALNEELEEVRARLAPAERKRVEAAVDVLFDHGNTLAKELAALNARRRELSHILQGLSATPVDVLDRRQIGQTKVMADAINGILTNVSEFPVGTDPIYDLGQRWRKRLEAILADPDAQVTTPRLITPGDYTVKCDAWKGPGHPHPVPVKSLRAEN